MKTKTKTTMKKKRVILSTTMMRTNLGSLVLLACEENQPSAPMFFSSKLSIQGVVPVVAEIAATVVTGPLELEAAQ